MHPDYWAEEVVEVAAWGPAVAPVAITTVSLQRTQGSPPSPMYRFRVHSCNGQQCNLRESATFQVVDIALEEPSASFFGDLDPKTRVLMGEITIRAPTHAMGLQGFRLYPTADGDTNLDLRWSDTTGPNTNIAQFALNLNKSCPPDDSNEDNDHIVADNVWRELAEAPYVGVWAEKNLGRFHQLYLVFSVVATYCQHRHNIIRSFF